MAFEKGKSVTCHYCTTHSVLRGGIEGGRIEGDGIFQIELAQSTLPLLE
jgi:hypothetical protein